ncbi:WhiB family transcriptional regulator [Streptomyces sp. NPDC008125]|uniref:WhiB family transcriptional regulator n=1 Tax=Streptomyces sp. NPDC008125 TaxID=3364811 RepID=UPI0036EBBBD1
MTPRAAPRSAAPSGVWPRRFVVRPDDGSLHSDEKPEERKVKAHARPLASVWEWQARAACRGMKDSVFFSPSDERGNRRRRRQEGARAVCRACAVKLDCQSFAEASRQRYGVWGGMTERERRGQE